MNSGIHQLKGAASAGKPLNKVKPNMFKQNTQQKAMKNEKIYAIFLSYTPPPYFYHTKKKVFIFTGEEI